MVKHKTPTGKVGYYVWKAYILLTSLLELEDNDVLVWTDAGVTFLRDVRPLVAKYLAGSDVTAPTTPMLEGGHSKRDAFVLTDMDFGTVSESDQVASHVIIARKTPKSIAFARDWLAASEDPRIAGFVGRLAGGGFCGL